MISPKNDASRIQNDSFSPLSQDEIAKELDSIKKPESMKIAKFSRPATIAKGQKNVVRTNILVRNRGIAFRGFLFILNLVVGLSPLKFFPHWW